MRKLIALVFNYSLPAAPEHPWSAIVNAGRKVVFSRSMKTADWNNTTIASGDTVDEIEALRQGGDGHIIVWGAASRSGSR